MEDSDKPKSLDDLIEVDPKLIIRDMCLDRIGLPTLDEMGDLFPAFLSHQRINKDSLISTGLARSWFALQPLFPLGFANLYFTSLPAKVDVGPMEGGGWQIGYTFLHDWGLIEYIPTFLPSTEIQAKIGGYTYVRLPDINYMPGWLKLKATPRLTEDANNAAIIPFLTPWDVAEIGRRRGLLYEIKEAVIKEISETLHARDTSRAEGLWSRCAECVKCRKVSKELLELLLAVEHRCRFLRVPPYHMAEFQVSDQSLGGLGELFTVVSWVDLALNEKQYDVTARFWKMLKEIIQQRGKNLIEADYQYCVDLLNEDMKAFGIKPQGEEVVEDIADWVRFVAFQSTLAAGRLSAELDVDYPFKLTVPREQVPKVKDDLADIEQTLQTWLPKSDTIALRLEKVYRGGNADCKSKNANLFQRKGDYWQIRFDIAEISVRDTRGLRYISHLLTNPRKHISAVQLVQLASGTSVESSAKSNTADLEVFQDEYAILDRITVADCQRVVAELERRIADPEIAEDELDGLIDKKQRIEDYLKSGIGKGGKSRAASNPAEKARSAVSMAVTRVLDKLENDLPSLHRHLKQSLSLGRTCTYDPQEEINWNVTS